MKTRQALIWGAKELKNLKSSAIDAEVLLIFIIKKDKTWLFSHLDGDLSSKIINKYKKLISRRKKGEPIAYIIQRKEFFGLDFYVDKSVLIPRPETELLVELALDQISNQKYQIKNILDLGTGSGCIIVSLAKNLKPISYKLKPRYYASDISFESLKVARKNARKHKAKIHFIKSNLFENIPSIKFDIIIANLPYLQKKDIKGEIIHEPKRALLGGEEGVAIIKRFLLGSKNYLAKKGKIIIEIDPRQTKIIKNMAKNIYPDKKVLLKQDLSQLDRMMILR